MSSPEEVHGDHRKRLIGRNWAATGNRPRLEEFGLLCGREQTPFLTVRRD